jgi:hypothetical protein
MEQISDALHNMYSKFRGQRKQPELSDLVECMTSSATLFSYAFIILDALDECEETQRELLLEVLGELKAKSVKIFATSRPHVQDAQEFFQAAPLIHIRADPLDLENFLTRKLNKTRKLKDNKVLKEKVVHTLSTSADGV